MGQGGGEDFLHDPLNFINLHHLYFILNREDRRGSYTSPKGLAGSDLVVRVGQGGRNLFPLLPGNSRTGKDLPQQ